jgi:hypothetical protein
LEEPFVQTANYLEQARSLLTRNALRVAPLALVVVGVAYATPSNTLTFFAPYLTSTDDNCGGLDGGLLSGTPTNGGLGLSLYGTGTMSYSGSGASCTMTLSWTGTGSGLFGGTTGTVSSLIQPGFTITPQNGSIWVNGWNLSVSINGNPASQIASCSSNPPPTLRKFTPQVGFSSCSGGSSPSGSFTVPSSLSTWRVVLAVAATWYNSSTATLTVNVSTAGSIDLLAQQGTPAVPALTPLAFITTAMLLLSLAGFGILRRNSSGSGFPGQPS